MPPNKLLEILLSDMTERASTLAKKRDNLTSKLKSIEGKVELEERIYFSTVVGERGAHEKAVRMCDEAREEILYVISGFGLRRAMDDGLLESFKRQAHRGVRVRVISEIQESNVKEAKLFLNLCELRHVDQLATHLLIVDHTQALVGVSIKGSSPIDSKEHIELWTNNPDYISTMKRFFQELWNNATGGRVKIQSIEAARPMEEFKIIRGRTETLRKIIEMVDNAESEINHITTANGLYRIYQAHYENYEKLREKGVKIRILAPMTEDNVKVAAKLAKFASLRNLAPSSTIRLCLVDNKEMILFEPLPDDPTIDAGLFVAFWNNNKAYVELMKSVFESMWSNASQVHLTD